jgi:hypothetical protein
VLPGNISLEVPVVVAQLSARRDELVREKSNSETRMKRVFVRFFDRSKVNERSGNLLGQSNIMRIRENSHLLQVRGAAMVQKTSHITKPPVIQIHICA